MEDIIIKHISRTCYACPSQWEAEDVQWDWYEREKAKEEK
jgi:hypothetical protein